MATLDSDAGIARRLLDVLGAVPDEKARTRPATVSRVDADGTVWVRMLGADGDTPVGQSAVTVEAGDTVAVTIANGRATLDANVSSPVTSTSYVEAVRDGLASDVVEVDQRITRVQGDLITAVNAASGWETMIREYGDGVLVCREGNVVGALVNADGSFDVVTVEWDDDGVPTAGEALSSFGEGTVAFYDGTGSDAENIMARFGAGGAQVGKDSEPHMLLDSNGMTLFDGEGESSRNVTAVFGDGGMRVGHNDSPKLVAGWALRYSNGPDKYIDVDLGTHVSGNTKPAGMSSQVYDFGSEGGYYSRWNTYWEGQLSNYGGTDYYSLAEAVLEAKDAAVEAGDPDPFPNIHLVPLGFAGGLGDHWVYVDVPISEPEPEIFIGVTDGNQTGNWETAERAEEQGDLAAGLKKVEPGDGWPDPRLYAVGNVYGHAVDDDYFGLPAPSGMTRSFFLFVGSGYRGYTLAIFNRYSKYVNPEIELGADTTVAGEVTDGTGNVLSHKLDAADAVTGVKGELETSYRKGNVSLSIQDIGAASDLHVHEYSEILNPPTIPSANTLASNIQMDGTRSAGSLETYAKADHVHPTDTSRAGASHVHGNITNDGAITSDSSFGLVIGDRLLVAGPNADGSKIRRSPVYFGGDETLFLTNKGTWKSQVDAGGIYHATVDPTSTATAFTATIEGIEEYHDGLAVYLTNGVVTSAAGFTLDVNSLGAKPVYNNMAAATAESTIFNVNYSLLFIYNSQRISGGCWDCYRGYDSNTNTIGYQLRTNNGTRPAASTGYRYRLWLTSADGQSWVPINTSSATNATTARSLNAQAIDPFGPIVYNSYNGTTAAGAGVGSTTIWQQYALTIGYSYVKTLVAYDPVYLRCMPQPDGSAVMDDIVQALPRSEDGFIYIFLGIAYSTTAMELRAEHPIYEYKDGAIRQWTGVKLDRLAETDIDAIIQLAG